MSKILILTVLAKGAETTDTEFCLVNTVDGSIIDDGRYPNIGVAVDRLYNKNHIVREWVMNSYGNAKLVNLEDAGISREEILKRNYTWYNNLHDKRADSIGDTNQDI